MKIINNINPSTPKSIREHTDRQKLDYQYVCDSFQSFYGRMPDMSKDYDKFIMKEFQSNIRSNRKRSNS
jgi:hypothetical protein